jgi:lipoprotein-anchoring transpeptidase ErfK/SrfK
MRKLVLGAFAAAAMVVGMAVPGSAAGLVAKVDISNQTMTITRHGQVMHVWRVSTARKGYVTPRGSWRPTRLHKMWYSRKYDMSPMPYSVFFHGGYAIHGTNAVSRLGSPASHGCIRLDTSNAAKFYSMVKQVGPGNTRIIITN